MSDDTLWLLLSILLALLLARLSVRALVRWPTLIEAGHGHLRCILALAQPLNAAESADRAGWVLTASPALVVALAAALGLDGPILLAFACLATSVLALALIDARAFLLPDLLVMAVAATGLGVLLAHPSPPIALRDGIIGAFAGGLVLLVVGLGYRGLRGREGLGLGDVKLVAAAGLWLGWQGLAHLLVVASLTTLAVVLSLAVLRRETLDHATPVPLGVGLSLALVLLVLVTWRSGPLL